MQLLLTDCAVHASSVQEDGCAILYCEGQGTTRACSEA